jgi:hypothetical protein
VAVKYLKAGQDFHFPSEFGFSGSNVAPRSHPRIEPDPYDDGLAGPKRNVREPIKPSPQRLAVGGPAMPQGAPPPAGPPPGQPPMSGGVLGALTHGAPGGQEPTISMPVSSAIQAAQNLVQTGAKHGAAAAGQAVMQHFARHRPPMVAPSGPPAAAPPQGAPAMAKGGKFIQGAIKHKGRETQRAKAAGRSVHDQMEHDKHSNDPSLRGAANLGLRLTGGDLSPHRKKGK